jgi:inositol-phosphate phosphatase / L-galactose 1-phosphate phosphatase / histidinol-phosphatase
MNDYSQELATAKDIAKKAGIIMRTYFEKDVPVERKKDDSPVTKADLEINRLVIEELNKVFDDGIIGEEESTAEYGMGRRWICDPIDGTRAFTWGVPTAMFSLGLVEDGTPIVGVAYDAFLDRLYEAITKHGSFCNGKSIRVSYQKISGGSVGISSSPEKALNNPSQATLITNLLEKKARLASFSGSVYRSCLVAQGKLVGYVEKDINPHDLAAVEVIVKEAGGMVTDFAGNPLDYSKAFKGAIISNTVTHNDLLSCVKNWV